MNMMDYYSNSPAPTIDECKDQLKNHFIKNDLYMKHINNYILEDIINNVFISNDLIKNNKIECSLTGWNVFGKQTLIDDINTKILCILIEKKKKFRRRIRGLLKSSYLLIKCYKQSKENMYNPDSDFMKEIYSKYN